MTTTTNVFVYHKEDREANFLADVIHRLDQTSNTFRFLALTGPDRLESLLRVHGLDPAHVSLPLLVVMQDLTGRNVQTHRILHGDAFQRWLDQVVQHQILAQPDPTTSPLVEHCRRSLLGYLTNATLQIARLCLCVGGATPIISTPTDDPHPPPVAAPPPPARAATRPIATPAAVAGVRSVPRHPGIGSPDTGSSEAVQVGAGGTQEGTDAWTEATTPDPRNREKVVNIAEAMGNARSRMSTARDAASSSSVGMGGRE